MPRPRNGGPSHSRHLTRRARGHQRGPLNSRTSAGGKIEGLCREILAWSKPLLTLDGLEKAALLALNAKGIQSQR